MWQKQNRSTCIPENHTKYKTAHNLWTKCIEVEELLRLTAKLMSLTWISSGFHLPNSFTSTVGGSAPAVTVSTHSSVIVSVISVCVRKSYPPSLSSMLGLARGRRTRSAAEHARHFNIPQVAVNWITVTRQFLKGEGAVSSHANFQNERASKVRSYMTYDNER